MNKLALLLSIISSPDVQDIDTQYTGKCSWFQATNVSALGFSDAAFRLPVGGYCACRWRYDALARKLHIERKAIKAYLREHCEVRVLNPRNGRSVMLTPVDWGPARKTGRAIDMDKASLESLDAVTDEKLIFELRRAR